MFRCCPIHLRAPTIFVHAGGTTAPSGTVAPVTLSSHVSGYSEHIDVNHQPYWQALPALTYSGVTGKFEAFTQHPESSPENSTHFNDTSNKSPGRNHSTAPAGRLRRRPEEPLPTADLSPPFVGAIASGRSVFTRHMPWALKLKLKLDSDEVGLLDSWEEPDNLHDTSLEHVRIYFSHFIMCNCPFSPAVFACCYGHYYTASCCGY